MFNFRPAVLLSLTLMISGCETLNFDRWFGNECEDDDCEAPQLLDNSKSTEKWYCYGREEGGEWQCGNSSDPQKIVSVTPKPRKAESVARLGQPIDSEMMAKDVPAQTTAQASTPAPAPTPAPAVLQKPMAEMADSGSLMDLPSTFYAVQLIALQSEQEVVNYASDLGIEEPIYARIRSQGSDWYVLLLGTYPSRDTAEIAKNTWLNGKQPSTQPWVRSLGPLQEAIAAAR